MAQFTRVGGKADPWNTVADWAIVGGGAAGRDPTGDDAVTLAGSGATITGDGVANQLVVQAAYQLTGTITLAASSTAVAPALTVDNGGLPTIAGAINDAPSVGEGTVVVGNGQLAVFGPNVDQPASLASNGLVIGDPGYDGLSEVDVTLGTLAIAHKTTVMSGDIAIGAHGSGVLNIRYLGTVTANTVEVQSGTATGGDNVLSVGPSGTLAVAGALTIGDNATTIAGGGGTLIDDGALTAGSIEIASDGSGVLKGNVFTNALTVDAGGIITGAAAFYGIGSTPDDSINPPMYKPIAIVDNGTIEGAVGVAPMTLAGPVSGTGTLLIDAGGGIEVAGAVASTINVRFAPGASPFNIGSDGSAGGVLDLIGLGATYNLAGFGATIFGFAPGDQIDVDPALGVTAATLGVGNVLSLSNASNTVVGTLKLDPTANYAADAFVVQPAPVPQRPVRVGGVHLRQRSADRDRDRAQGGFRDARATRADPALAAARQRPDRHADPAHLDRRRDRLQRQGKLHGHPERACGDFRLGDRSERFLPWRVDFPPRPELTARKPSAIRSAATR